MEKPIFQNIKKYRRYIIRDKKKYVRYKKVKTNKFQIKGNAKN